MSPKVFFNIASLVCLCVSMVTLFGFKGLIAFPSLLMFILFWNPGKVD